MPVRKRLKVILVAQSVSPENLVSLGARLCYSQAEVDNLREKVSRQDQADFIRKLLSMGHESALEHASFTFGIEGVSRVLLAQLTRHRIASFSVQSQRYVSYENGFGYILPPAIEALGQEAADEYARQMETMHKWYTDWQKKLGGVNEDARFVLPGACETRLLLTMNVRELRHFFSLRMCRRAQWEIRALANEMFRLCYTAAPELFADAGPGCIRGHCPEGAKSCGKSAEMRAAREELISSSLKE